MRINITATPLATALALSVLAVSSASAEAVNLGFEEGNLESWVGNQVNSVEMPVFGAQEGTFAAKTINPGGVGVSQIFQFLDASEGQTFEGETFYLSGYMRSEAEAGLPDGISFGVYKILFLDESNETLQPTSYCKGVINPDFPGAEALPFLDSDNSTEGAWIFAEAQAVAPPGTVRVGIELTNVNFTETEAPIWFDNVTFESDPVPRLGVNCGFETGDLYGWVPNVFEPWGGYFSVGAPLGPVGAQEGNYAAEVTNTDGIGVAQLLQFFPANPGDEYSMSVNMLTEMGLVEGISWGVPKLVFFNRESATPWVALVPRSVSKGSVDTEFPGLVAPLLDNNSPSNTWVFSELQGVAPPGTTEVMIELNNVNFTGAESPIWFDDLNLRRVRTDADVDGIADSVDTEPLSPSFYFSDGTSSGTISDAGNQVLWIVDEPGPDGLRILADTSGGSGIAKLSVCASSAILSIKAGNDLVVTCGSVTLEVEAGPSITMEIVLNGEPATVEVPPEISVLFEPETASLEVETTSTNLDPVILTIGGSDIEITPGQSLETIAIDIKPGTVPNCFNVNSKGVIPVAILGSGSLDIGDVDQESLEFGGLGVRIKGDGDLSCGTKDSNTDGYTDLVCHFVDDAKNWTAGDASATVSGELLDGTLISGTDSICIVP